MKISSKKSFFRRKKFIIALLIAILLIAAGAIVVALNNGDNMANTSSNKAKPEKTEPKEKSSQESVPSDNEQEKDAVRTEESTSSNASVEAPNITSAQQTGDFIRVSAIFTNSSSGKCILKFEKAGQATIQKEAPVVIGPSYYACNGFRVPVSELSSKGTWSIMLIHELNGKTASSKKEIDVQ